MECCKQGKSPTGSSMAKLCCEMVCGEPVSGSTLIESQASPQAESAVFYLVSLYVITFTLKTKPVVPQITTRKPLPFHSAPELYLQNSAFLI